MKRTASVGTNLLVMSTLLPFPAVILYTIKYLYKHRSRNIIFIMNCERFARVFTDIKNLNLYWNYDKSNSSFKKVKHNFKIIPDIVRYSGLFFEDKVKMLSIVHASLLTQR